MSEPVTINPRRRQRRPYEDHVREAQYVARRADERTNVLEVLLREELARQAVTLAELREELAMHAGRAASRADLASAREALEGATREAAAQLRVDTQADLGALGAAVAGHGVRLRALSWWARRAAVAAVLLAGAGLVVPLRVEFAPEDYAVLVGLLLAAYVAADRALARWWHE